MAARGIGIGGDSSAGGGSFSPAAGPVGEPVVHTKACVFEIRREAVRVKAKRVTPSLPPEYRRFCVDPQITTYEVLVALLARAFDIGVDFTVAYVAHDPDAQRDVYVSLLSDWDLDAAFLGASTPYLRLKVEVKPFDPGLEDWDVLSPLDVSALQKPQRWEFGERRRTSSSDASMRRPSLDGFFVNRATSQTQVQHFVGDKLPNAFASLSSQVGKAFSSVSQAMRGVDLADRLSSSSSSSAFPDPRLLRPSKSPMSRAELENFLDSDGRLVRPLEFRKSVYHGGIETSLRRALWPHLLNVYPHDLTGQQRIDYMKKKSEEYEVLRKEWTGFGRDDEPRGYTAEEVRAVTSMVQKDVLRTDRTHKFYAGEEETGNVVKLFNVLVTFALNHPKVSYCQGMGDLASPILVVMGDESRAYVCFCALMRRVSKNFMTDGIAMTTKFNHLSLLLEHHDPVFSQYLKDEDAFDLFFCFRWLLLELKREFPFEEALVMLEIHWASFYPSPPHEELPLTDYDSSSAPESNSSPLPPPNSVSTSDVADSSTKELREEENVSRSLPPRRPPPPFHRQSSSSTSYSGEPPPLPPQTHYTRLRDQVKHLPSSLPSLRPTTPNGRGAASPASSAGHIYAARRKPSVVSADESVGGGGGDFDQIFETSLTKTVEKTKVFLDRHLENLSGVTHQSKRSFLQATQKRTHSLKSIFAPPDSVRGSTRHRSNDEDDGEFAVGSTTISRSFTTNPFVNGEFGIGAMDSSPATNFSLDDDNEIPSSSTNPFLNPFLGDELEGEDGDRPRFLIDEDDRPNDSLPHDNNNNDDDDDCSGETGGCDSVDPVSSSSSSSSLPMEESQLTPTYNNNNNNNDSPQPQPVQRTISTTTWYCDPFLGRPEESTLNHVTFLDSCESAHESVGGGGEEAAAAAAAEVEELLSLDESWEEKRGRDPSSAQCQITTTTKTTTKTTTRATSALGENESRSTAFSLSEFDADLVRATETVDPSDSPARHRRRSSSLTENGASFGSLTVDFVQVCNVETPPLEPLPPPEILGDGCPFLLFLCLTLLLQQRDAILKRHLDSNEVAIHFDKMVRRHRVDGVLRQARHLYAEYLKRQEQRLCEEEMTREMEGEAASRRRARGCAAPTLGCVADLGISV